MFLGLFKSIFLAGVFVLFPFTAIASNIPCEKLNFKGGVYVYADMEDDEENAVQGSFLFQPLTVGLVFHGSENLIQAHFEEGVTYSLSDIRYKISHHPVSDRCQLTFEYEKYDKNNNATESRQESFELIALSYSGTYWFGQKDKSNSEVYFYLEKNS